MNHKVGIFQNRSPSKPIKQGYRDTPTPNQNNSTLTCRCCLGSDNLRPLRFELERLGILGLLKDYEEKLTLGFEVTRDKTISQWFP